MHNIVFVEVVQADQNLNGEPLDQVETESLEVVHLDELIQVHTQHLESDHQVLPEQELVQSPNDILLVFGVVVVQVFDQFGFHQTLFVQSFLVLQDLEGYILFLFVVVCSHHYAKTAFSKLLVYLVTVAHMLVYPIDILVVLVVEAMVSLLVD